MVLGGDASPYAVIVMLGRRVRFAFSRALHVEMAQWSVARVGAVTLLAFPHPSGRCQIWNQPTAKARALAALREVAPEIAWGMCASS
jgi:uracil-DNA glycosylase